MVEATEQLLKVHVAIERVSGDRPTSNACHRWMHCGLLTKSGERVYLEFTKCGKTPKTSVEAVRRFFAALTEAPGRSPRAVQGRAHGEAAHEDAERELLEAGA